VWTMFAWPSIKVVKVDWKTAAAATDTGRRYRYRYTHSYGRNYIFSYRHTATDTATDTATGYRFHLQSVLVPPGAG
jgi:hypothetical protein